MSIAAYLAKLSEGVNSSGILSTSKGGTGTTSGGAFPTITSISYGGDENDTATDVNGGKTVTITGANFAPNAKILINGVAAPVVSVVSPTTITFTTPAMAAGTYVLYMVNADGSTAIAVPGISFSGVPTWSTAAGTVATLSETQPISASLGVTSNSAITLSLLSGSLPSGAVLNSNGTISGTSQLTASPTTYTFTIRATDAELQDTDRQFSIVINPETIIFTNPTNGGTLTAYTGLSNTINLSAGGSAGNSISSYNANTLPAGLTLAGSTITGTPTALGTSSTTLTATTANTGRTGQITFSWTVLVGGDTYWKNTSLLLSGTSTADSSLTDYLILNNQVIPVGDTRTTNFNPYQAGYYSNQFNGTTDFLSIANNASFANLNGVNFTVECWAWANSTSSNACLMACTSNPTASGFAVFILSGNLTVYVNTGATVIGSITFPINAWNHVAFVRNGTTCTLYLNGAVVASATADITNPAATQPLVIGGITASTGWNSALYFNGYISNARVVKGTALYTAAFTPPTAPLTAATNTSLLTSRSARFIDAGPNNFTITSNGTPSVQQFNPFGIPATATTNNLYSTYFDGTGDRLSIASNALLALGTGDFTIEMWVYNQSTTNRLISWGVTTSPIIFINSSNQLVYENYGVGMLQTSTSTISLNTWTHVALSRNTGVTRMYINGVVANSTPLADTNNWGQSGLYIGVDTATTYMTGSISNLRVLKGTGLYPSGTTFTPPTSSLTAVTNTLLLTCQDATIRDNSTNQFTITSTGDARPVAQSPFTQTTTTIGLNNVGSTYFDGTGDAAYIAGDGNVVNFGNGDYTIEAWVYHTTGLNVMDTCPGGTVTPTNRIQFLVNTDGSVTYITYQGNVTLIITATGLALPRQWHHVALVKYNNQTRIYVNGVQGGSTYADTLTMPSQSNRPFINGNGYDGSTGAACYISNYRITKGVAVYTTTFTPPTVPLTVGKGTQALFYQTSQAPNNSQFVDNSPAANPITRFGNTSQGTFAPYGANWSNYFDGTGDYLTCPNINFGTNNFTIEGWFYPTTIANLTNFWGTNNASGSAPKMLMYINSSGNLTIDMGNVGTTQFPVSASAATYLKANAWNHIAVVRSGVSANQFALYINGISVSTGQLGTSISGITAIFNIGYIGEAYGQAFSGYISDFRITNGTAVYASNFTPATTPLTPVANTSLLTCQDGRFVDNSGSNFTITRNGDVSAQRFSPYGAMIQTPQTYSTNFVTTTDSRFTVPAGTAFAYGTGDFTVEGWFLVPTMTAATGPLIFSQTVSGTNYFYNGLQQSGSLLTGKVVFIGTASGGGTEIASGSNLFTAGTWNHFAVCRASGTVTVYLNGVGGTPTANATDFNNITYVPTIGGYTHGTSTSLFNGNISSLRVIKGTAVYTANFTPPTAPLTAVAGTSLLTCQNTTLRDNSTNAFTVTSTGTATPKTINPFGYTNTQGQAYTPALYGASAYFDGTGDYLSTPNSTNFNLGSSDFTIEGWWYPISSGDQNIVAKWWTGGSQWVVQWRTTGNFRFAWNTSTTADFSVTLQLNSWCHFAVVRSGVNLNFYFNGVKNSAVGTIGAVTATTDITTIGQFANGSSTYLSGYLSDMRVVTGTALYTGNFVPPQTPVTATKNTTLLLNMDKGALVDYTKSVNLETVADTKINNESAYNGGYYSNYFDGSGDTFSTPAGINTAMGVGFAGNIISIESWVFPQNFNFGAYGQMIAGAYAAVSANGRWYIGFDKTANSTTQLVMGWTTSSSTQTGVTTTTFPITHGQWNHIAVTVDATTAASSTIKLFANGVLLNTFTAQDLSTQTAYYQPTQIGGCGSTTYTSEFHGYISNFRILKGSLAYTGNYTVPTAPLTAITNTALLTCQSNKFVDNSTNAFALTRNGDVLVSSLNPFQRNTKTSMYFDGTGDLLSIPINPVFGFGTGDFTVEFWMNLNSLMTTEMDILDCQTTNAFCIYKITTSGALAWRPYAGTDQTILAHASIPIRQWVHVAVSRSSGTTKAFVNGVQTNSVADATNYAIPTVVYTVGGRNGGTFGVPGYIEDLRITRGYARYTANFAPTTTKFPSN